MFEKLFEQNDSVSLRISVPLGDASSTQNGQLELATEFNGQSHKMTVNGQVPKNLQWLGNLGNNADFDSEIQFSRPMTGRCDRRHDVKWEKFVGRCHTIRLERNLGVVHTVDYRFEPVPRTVAREGKNRGCW